MCAGFSKWFVFPAALALLAGCGGGSDSTDNPAAASVQACFSADTTVSYKDSYSGNDSIFPIGMTVGPATYNGQAATAMITFASDGTSATDYLAVVNGNVVDLATVFSSGGAVTYSPIAVVAPLSIQPGQSFNQQYRMVSNNTFSGTITDTTTFIGFETLTLAGKTFTNVCHFKDHSIYPTGTVDSESWYAPGYGNIYDTSISIATDGTQITGTAQYNGSL